MYGAYYGITQGIPGWLEGGTKGGKSEGTRWIGEEQAETKIEELDNKRNM